MSTKNNTEILSTIECPICVQFMFAPIYQCTTGHSVCSSCKIRLDKCPICTAEMGSTRNYTLEKLVLLLDYPCPFSKYGCRELQTWVELDRHKRICPNRMYKCPFCPKNSIWEGAIQELGEHLVNNHEIFRLNDDDSDGKFSIPYILNYPIRRNLIGFLYVNDSVFYFYKGCSNNNSTINNNNIIQYAVQFVGNNEEAKNYAYQLCIQSRYSKFRTIQTTEICSSDSATFDEIIDSGHYISVPESVLRTYGIPRCFLKIIKLKEHIDVQRCLIRIRETSTLKDY